MWFGKKLERVTAKSDFSLTPPPTPASHLATLPQKNLCTPLFPPDPHTMVVVAPTTLLLGKVEGAVPHGEKEDKSKS